jgi:serine/threonine protein kinase
MAETRRCLICSSANPAAADTCQTCGAALAGDPATGFSSALPVGTRLQSGRYSVGKVLGQGGFGITYLGGDTQARRAVAIKELFPYGSLRRGLEVEPAGSLSAADYATARDRFLQEAQILTRFQHPGIVDVYASFLENNSAYMVMELLRGRSLGALLEERGPLPQREAVDYIRRAGEALETVHQASLLHRDIKPDNIMLTDDGRVVLIDFGTARIFTAGQTGRMTTMVTPGYAPLEQYGQQVRFGPFTDIYALGATLYHLLTGQMPTAATDRATGLELQPPRALNRSIDVETSEAVMWALEMRVDRRPQRVSEFLEALERADRPAPAAPAAPQPVPRREPTPRRSRTRQPPALPPLPPAGPYEIDVASDNIRWPDECACCFEPADASYPLEAAGSGGPFGLFVTTRSWDAPYCSACLEHMQRYHSQSANGLSGLAAAAPLAGLVLGGPVGMLIGMGGAAAASIFSQAKQQSEIEALLKPTCVSVGLAAAYLGWQDFTHAFTFLNRDFAAAFRQENAAALVG